MGFTIGGIRDLRSTSRRRGRASEPVTTVAEYTGLWGWDVVPGARAARAGGRVTCSCGATGCPSPGAHPLAFAPSVPAGATLDEAAAAWAEVPGAAVLLPVGRSFDVLEVPEAAGRHALARLERMGLPLGPVALTPHERALFSRPAPPPGPQDSNDRPRQQHGRARHLGPGGRRLVQLAPAGTDGAKASGWAPGRGSRWPRTSRSPGRRRGRPG
ncbi:bifunctional DNA primase/polymerase, partial [Streptomyces cinnamoneus]|uniref:bifunctional DNA primase/polymerase n=1 Tax=Streptomyces cinnamoneus TaxID=53446 RepID=UPI001EFDAAA3